MSIDCCEIDFVIFPFTAGRFPGSRTEDHDHIIKDNALSWSKLGG